MVHARYLHGDHFVTEEVESGEGFSETIGYNVNFANKRRVLETRGSGLRGWFVCLTIPLIGLHL